MEKGSGLSPRKMADEKWRINESPRGMGLKGGALLIGTTKRAFSQRKAR